MKLHIWKILNINANVGVPSWAPKCAGISTKNSAMLISKQEFYLWKLEKNQNTPSYLNLCWALMWHTSVPRSVSFCSIYSNKLTSQHWSYNNWECRLYKFYHHVRHQSHPLSQFFSSKLSFQSLRRYSDTWNITLILLLIATEWNCIYGKS